MKRWKRIQTSAEWCLTFTSLCCLLIMTKVTKVRVFKSSVSRAKVCFQNRLLPQPTFTHTSTIKKKLSNGNAFVRKSQTDVRFISPSALLFLHPWDPLTLNPTAHLPGKSDSAQGIQILGPTYFNLQQMDVIKARPLSSPVWHCKPRKKNFLFSLSWHCSHCSVPCFCIWMLQN